MNASGGGCRMSTYNGNTCMTYNGNSYMGTDCNGFVGYIYHMSIGLESSSGRFFEPLYNDKDWKTLYSNYFQKNEKVKTVQEALNIAQPGDAIARICDEVNGSHHNHIGVYVGNGMMVENSGSTSSVDGRLTPLVYRKVEEFAKIGSYSSSNYKNCVLTVFTLKKF